VVFCVGYIGSGATSVTIMAHGGKSHKMVGISGAVNAKLGDTSLTGIAVYKMGLIFFISALGRSTTQRGCDFASRATGHVGSRGLFRLSYDPGSLTRLNSADATIASQATGAMSWAFITALKKNPQQSYVQLLNSIRDELATRYSQKPQLSCSHPLSLSSLSVGIQRVN
jgi:hypothetical protein